MSISIRRARRDEAGLLTEIAHASKRHWGYRESWIRLWKATLTLEPDFVERFDVWLGGSGEAVDGFYALIPGLTGDGSMELEHFWVRPERMGRGAGRALFDHAAALARRRGAQRLEISSDPNAEGFYGRMGAKTVGRVAAHVEGHERFLPRMVFTIDG